MKPQKPTPRQELEASLTALLLGELPPDKAAALREAITKDAELARLYERLEKTIGLVRETAVPAEQGTQSAPLKLSNKRREQLLQHFKTIAPKEFIKPERRKIAARELAIAAGIVAFIGLAAWLFNQEHYASMARTRAQLGRVDEAAAQYAARSPTPVANPPVTLLSDQTAAELPINGSLAPAQNPFVVNYALTAGGGGGDMGRPSQTIFDHEPAQQSGGAVIVGSAGSSIANQIVLPSGSDWAVSPSLRGFYDDNLSTQPNSAAGDAQWLGALERPVAHSSINQFVNRSASIVAQTNQLDLDGMANLFYAPQVTVSATAGVTTNAIIAQDAGKFLYALDLNRNGNFNPQETTEDSAKPTSRSTGGFARTGTPAFVGEVRQGSLTNTLPINTEVPGANWGPAGPQQQNDELSRRQAGGLAWADNMHQKQGNLGLADGSVEQMSRSKLQEGLGNSSTPAEKVPVIDPATGLPVPGAYARGIDPATGLSIPIEVAKANEKPASVPLATRAFQVETNAFFAAIEPFKDAASHMPTTGGGMGGGGGGGRTIPGLPARTLREPALAPAQTTSPPMAGEKLAEVAQEGKDISGSNIYLGKELAKADVKFGTWSLETGQPAAQPGGTKKEEEKLKQVGEVADGVIIANVGDVPALGKTFKGAEAKPGQTTSEVEPPPGDLALARSTNGPRDRDAKLLFEMGQLDEAESLFKQAATEDPNNRAAQYYLNLIKDNRFRRSLAGKEFVTLQSMTNIQTAWLNPSRADSLDSFTSSQAINPSAKIRGDVVAIGGDVRLNGDSPPVDWSFGTVKQGSLTNTLTKNAYVVRTAPVPIATNLVGMQLLGDGSNRGRIEQAGEPKIILNGITQFSNSIVLPLKVPDKGEQYDRYAEYRSLGQSGAEGNKKTNLALNHSDVQDSDSDALGKSSGAATDEMIPPGTIDFRGEDLTQALGLYSQLTGRTVERATNLPSPMFLFDLKQPMKKGEAIKALDTAFAMNGIAIVDVGDKFAKAAPVAAAGQMAVPSNDPEKLSKEKANDRQMITHLMQVDTNAFREATVSSGLGGGRAISITGTNGVAAVQGDLRKFFESMGAHLGPRESVFYNDRDGTLLVCATLENAKIIRDATEVLNQPAPNINIAAKFAEVSSNKDLALNTPSVPNAYARTNLIWASSGRQLIDDKLNRLRLDPITYEGLPLSEVLINLNEQAKKHDPEKRGVNIIINPNLPKASLPPGQVDPSTGLPITAIVGAADLGAVSVKTNLNLQDLSLRQALDAIVAASDKPIKYSIEDYAVVFSAAGTKADWQDPKVPVKPVTPPLIPQPEVQTRENAFSTFSLNVSDVAFKLAGASLEKGQMPESASIRSEEFINAFDYRDPEAPAGVPVAFAWERARYPYAQNRDLLRFSIKTAAQGRQAGRPLNLVLLMDNSGSMERADRIAIIREALKVLASQLQPQDKLSVITFARTAQLRVDGVPGSQASQVAEDIGGLTPEGGTNIEEAMNLAYQTALRHYLANGINRVVLLTDGAANLGNVEPESLKQKVEVNRKQGVALDCFGIGWEGFNDDLLETLSRNGDGRYGFINSPEEAATEFAGQLAGALNVAASDVKVQVEFNPNRVTAYRQIGYAKHQLTKEQFRDNTVDAAEIAAQEAGNALYVIEVNPAGQGPVATVRVRFKVPDTSDYREHEWSVPFNGNAVALEQASPAMRLAATASAFSEWLASSPFATEVTPDTLLSYLSGVPEVYGADARPKKLEWMIRQAKSLAGGENRGSNVETRNKPEESKPKDANRVQFP